MPTANKMKASAVGKAAAAHIQKPSSSSVNPRKRKMDAPQQKYYAVRCGVTPGVYLTWAECQANTAGFSGANYKSFLSREEAELFVAGKNPNPGSKPTRFYAVAIGSKPGIYTDWTEAQMAYQGVKAPKYKKFDTREAAEEFMEQFGPSTSSYFVAKDAEAGPATKKTKTSASGSVAGGSANLLNIYTDGSSRGNGKAGAVAGVGVFFGKGDPRNISERLQGDLQTNQRAELTAILRALQVVPVTQGVQIFSDSKYGISCVTEWYVNWQKNGWRSSAGEEVKNQDLVKAVRAKIDERNKKGTQTVLTWVKGHSVDAGNVAADQLAVEGAKKRG